jgi:hypothetical protein
LERGAKPKKTRIRKTTKEKIDALIEKEALKLFKKDESVRNAYIKKIYGIEVVPELEREISNLIAQTRLRLFSAAAEDLVGDPTVRADTRQKLLADLLGVPYQPPRAREQGGHPQRNTFQSQLEKIKQTMKLADEYRELLGFNKNSWSGMLKDPELIKAVLGIIQSLMGPSGSTSEPNTVSSNEQLIMVEINGEWKEMDQRSYSEYLSQKKELGMTQTNQTVPPLGGLHGATGPAGSSANSPSSHAVSATEGSKLPEKEIQSPVARADANQPAFNKEQWNSLASIIEAMDKPPEEFVKKTVELIYSGDQGAAQVRDFLLANTFDRILKELSQFPDYTKRLVENRVWYDLAVAAIKSQSKGTDETGAG